MANTWGEALLNPSTMKRWSHGVKMETKNQTNTKKNSKALAGMANALAQFADINREMSVLQMRVFVCIALRKRVTVSEAAKSLGMSSPNVSRCIAVLSDFAVARRKAEPMGLVQLEVDPMDRRVKYIVLSEKGKAFAESLTSQF